MTISEIVAVLALVVSALTLTASWLKEKRGDILTSQSVRDKLDYISDTTRDTREEVRNLDRKLDDHASRLTKVEAKVDEHDRRLERIEGE